MDWTPTFHAPFQIPYACPGFWRIFIRGAKLVQNSAGVCRSPAELVSRFLPAPLVSLRSVDYEGTGRKLGVGMKVLGRMAKQRLDKLDEPAKPATVPPNPRPPVPRAAAPPVAVPPVAARKAKAVREGGRRFGHAVWGPFTKAGHVLWLEITGLFFALFGIYFFTEAWKRRADWQAGSEHTHLLVYAAVTLVFGYFCVTSFVRARKRSKR